MKRAKEPRNYLWENMAFTYRYKLFAKVIVMIVLTVVLLICYKFQYNLQYQTTYLGQFEKMDC